MKTQRAYAFSLCQVLTDEPTAVPQRRLWQ